MRRAYFFWGSLLAGSAAAMALVPGISRLFGLVGFESSFVLGALGSLAGVDLGARAVARRRMTRSPSDTASDDARPLSAAMSLFGGSLARLLLLLAVPLLLLIANAARVRNCNMAGGLLFFALLPGLSAVTSSAAGTVTGLLVGRRGLASGLAISLVVGSFAWGVARFYTAPPVFGFDPFVGWFPGTLYDEELAVDQTLLIARGVHLLGTAAALALAAAFLDGNALRLRRPRGAGAVLASLALLGAYLATWVVARPIIAPDARSIADALGARRETAHFTLLYSPTGPWARDIEAHAADAEFRYAQLAKALHVEPEDRITCYLFDSPAAKHRMMGASYTQVAKPWRREIYIQYAGWPHPVLKHELAHVFAAAHGDPVFHVARRGIGFNMGLVEGLAVALGDRHGRIDLDQQVKALRLAGLEPPLARVFSLGFVSESQVRAYTVAGSFVRFLLEEQGPAPFFHVYREGGSPESYVAAYGRPFEALAAAWSARVDAATLDAQERELGTDRARRPSVFRRSCAHDLAVRWEEALTRAAQGDHEGALELLRSICADEPGDPGPLLEVMEEEAAAQRLNEAEATARAVLARPEASDSQRARALMFLGDARLREWGDDLDQEARSALALLDGPADPAGVAVPKQAPRDAAASFYRRALELRLDEETARQLRARLLAIENPRLGRPLALYLVGDGTGRDPSLDLLRARAIIDAAPDDGFGHYLLGRALWNRERWAEAEHELDEATFLGLPPGFTVPALRLQGIAALRAHMSPAIAEHAFRRVLESREAHYCGRSEAEDFIARCRFLADPTGPR